MTPKRLRDLQMEAKGTAAIRDWWHERLNRARIEMAASEAGFAMANDAAKAAAAALEEATAP